jgi:hypothetical protein
MVEMSVQDEEKRTEEGEECAMLIPAGCAAIPTAARREPRGVCKVGRVGRECLRRRMPAYAGGDR